MSLRDKFDIEAFNLEFKGTRAFSDNTKRSTPTDPNYFIEFLNLLDDEVVLEHIRFANDYLDIPPVKSFINYRREYFRLEMSRGDKQCLGACFAYLYRRIYNYTSSESVWVGDIRNEEKKIFQTGIKTASVYRK